MIYVLYTIWFGLPAIYFCLGIYALTEKLGRSHKIQRPGEMFKQGAFLLMSACITFAIDRWILPSVAGALYIPIEFLQIAVFPAVVYTAAVLTGPTKPITVPPKYGSHPGKKR